MRVADVCSHHVVCIGPEAVVQEAAELMQKQQVGALVITSYSSGKRTPLGIVTDRDIVTNVIAAGKNPKTLSVAEVMAGSLATCRGDHELFDVIGLMHQRGIRRVPVVDAQNVLIGIVTVDDIIGALAEHVGILARSLIGDETLEERRSDESTVAV